MVRKALLACGILSSLVYVAMNIFAPMQRAFRYRRSDETTMASTGNRLHLACSRIRIGRLEIRRSKLASARFRWLAGRLGNHRPCWPPMHQRAVLAAGGGTLTDTLHLVMGGGYKSLLYA